MYIYIDEGTESMKYLQVIHKIFLKNHNLLNISGLEVAVLSMVKCFTA